MNLRAKLIEAGAEAAFNSVYSDPSTVAEVHLDAFLDCLYDKAEEWADAADDRGLWWPFDSALSLIAALRAEVDA